MHVIINCILHKRLFYLLSSYTNVLYIKNNCMLIRKGLAVLYMYMHIFSWANYIFLRTDETQFDLFGTFFEKLIFHVFTYTQYSQLETKLENEWKCD